MRPGELIGGVSRGGRGRLRMRSSVRPQRYAVLSLEALEPRELLSLTPAQKAIVADAIPETVISVLARAVVPVVIASPAPNLVDAADGRIPMPATPNATNLASAANANLVRTPLFGNALGLEAGMGSGDVLPQNATPVGSPPNPLPPGKKLLPPLPGQGNQSAPPSKPRIAFFGDQASDNGSANSQTGEPSGSGQDRAVRDKPILGLGNLIDAASTPSGQGDAGGTNAEAHDQAIVSLVPEEAVPGAPVTPPANAKPGSEGNLANRPDTVR